jgi:hypothetical protein
MNLPLVVDDIIPAQKQDELNYIMFKTLFPWFYQASLSVGEIKLDEYVDTPGFAHVFYNERGAISSFQDHVKIIVENSLNVINKKIIEMIYGRAFFQMPMKNYSGMSRPHVDVPEKDHLVVLYYALDSDGDTVLFDKKITDTLSTPLKECDIIQRISPKKGRVLIFDGKTYHANFLPKEHMRCVINFDLIVKDGPQNKFIQRSL